MHLHESLAKADKDTLKEIIRNAESYLGAQLTAALAANQRAMTFTNLLAAVTVVVAGAGASLIIGQQPRVALGLVCISVAIGFLAAMALAISAAKPTTFWWAGNTPAEWERDVVDNLPFEVSLAQQCSHYAEMISDNRECMAVSDTRLLWALRISWFALAAGGIATIVALYLQGYLSP